MTEQMEVLRAAALEAKTLYLNGEISREEAKRRTQPYSDEYNRIAKEKAGKYHQKFRPFSFSAYMRSSY